MAPTDEFGGVRLYRGDCLDLLRELPAESVDLIATDPPYFGVKADDWDNQWDTADDYLAWMRGLCDEWQRVLKPNGSLYVFASPRMAARVECVIAGRFNVVNSITWQKDFPCGALKYGPENFRGYVEMCERIIFAEQDNTLGLTLKDRRMAAGLPAKELAAMFPSRTGGLTGCLSNWERGNNIPTREQWVALSGRLDLPGYDEAVRPFSVTLAGPYSDVWTYKPVEQARLTHPCEKPLAMMRHIVRASSRPGAVVLDCFMGSGTTGVACLMEDRQFVGVERDPTHYATALKRLQHADGAGSLFDPKQLTLTDG